MDRFLRQVVAQRELEQETSLLAADMASHCRVCDARTNAEGRVCEGCGGWRRAEQLDREKAVANRRAELVRLVIPEGESMAEEKERFCTSCKKRLRSNNTRDTCSNCTKGLGPASAGAQTAAHPPRGGASVRKNFKVLTEALGMDGDFLLEDFMQGWIDRVRSSVKVPAAEEYRLSGDDS